MTSQQKEDYKKEVKAALDFYIAANNLKDQSGQIIMQHLPNMYRHLEDKSLIKYGLTYQVFYRFAQEAFVFAQFMGNF